MTGNDEVVDAYREFLSGFFTEEMGIPEALLKDLSVLGKQLYYDPSGLKEFASEHEIWPVSAGLYLGELGKSGSKSSDRFQPSPAAVVRLASQVPPPVSTAVLDGKGSWLFLCGRDPFGVAVERGEPTRNKNVILFDEGSTILGYGFWLVGTIGPREQNQPVIKNKLDLGAYIRKK